MSLKDWARFNESVKDNDWDTFRGYLTDVSLINLGTEVETILSTAVVCNGPGAD